MVEIGEHRMCASDHHPPLNPVLSTEKIPYQIVNFRCKETRRVSDVPMSLPACRGCRLAGVLVQPSAHTGR